MNETYRFLKFEILNSIAWLQSRLNLFLPSFSMKYERDQLHMWQSISFLMNKKYSECVQFLKTAHRTNLCNGTRLQKQKVVPHQLYIYFFSTPHTRIYFHFLVYLNHSSRIAKIKNKILYLSHDFEKKNWGRWQGPIKL